MAFLQPDILPAMAEATHRQLRMARGRRLSEDALAALVTPAALSKGPGGPKLFTDTLRELRSIGAVIDDRDQLTLPDDVSGGRDAGGMPRIIRAKAMASDLTADLWEKDPQGSLLLGGARDLVRALAWFLTLDPRDGPFDYEKTTPALSELQEQQLGERPIYNLERWRPFVRWVRYLGFSDDMSIYNGGSSQHAVMPDPTRAIEADLLESLDEEQWTPLSTLVSRLASRLPVLDGGTYRRSVHDRGAPESDSDCSPSLTLAFLRLTAAGAIELQVGAGDAPKLTFANNQGAFHAARWHGGASARTS